jgi:hypothetical protein
LASPYPCEEQLRRRYEEEAKTAGEVHEAGAEPAPEGEEEEQDGEESDGDS